MAADGHPASIHPAVAEAVSAGLRETTMAADGGRSAAAGALDGERVIANLALAATQTNGSSGENAHARARRRPVLTVVGILFTPFVVLLGLWLVSFSWGLRDGNCTIGNVSADQYRQLYREASGQGWGVWPELSNGLFWPSDRGFGEPSLSFEKGQGDKLFRAIEGLSFDHSVADAQLAAAHAMMRSLGADYVSVFEIPDFPQNNVQVNEFVQFRYFLPERRFAPLCLLCFVFKYTTVIVKFRHDLVVNTHKLDGIVVLHSGLKYDPDPVRERNVSSTCPAFPANDHKRVDK